MTILIVASTRDVASINVRQQLLVHYGFRETSEELFNNLVYTRKIGKNDVKLATINEEETHYQDITKNVASQLVIYISRHSSKSGKPTLSVHTPGNLTNQARVGGIPRRISIAPANAMKKALQEMAQQRNRLGLDYQVSYECTHHGPSLDVPTMFVELGSSIVQWKDMKAAEAVAHAAMAPIDKSFESSTVAVGVGGPHYSGKFTRLALDGSFAFGHMIPKYAVSQIDAGTIKQCVERTVEKVETIVLDWKGIRGKDKPRLAEALEEVGIETQKA